MSKNLEPGTTIPDFELPDENGVMHRLSELQGDSVLVLHLSRGEHCPRERMHHRELLRFHELCAVTFTELVTIMPNSEHDVFRLKASTGAHWTFLADTELETRSHFGIDEYTDTHHDYAVVPHTLILSPGLRIEKVYVGYWFLGPPLGRPALDRPRRGLRPPQGRLRPDHVRGARGVGGEPGPGRCVTGGAEASFRRTARERGP